MWTSRIQAWASAHVSFAGAGFIAVALTLCARMGGTGSCGYLPTSIPKTSSGEAHERRTTAGTRGVGRPT